MRGATAAAGGSNPLRRISIHAPHAGRDGPYRWRSFGPAYFNPRAPCGARLGPNFSRLDVEHFNPRAPCGARPVAGSGSAATPRFQSTRPMRGATRGGRQREPETDISIHAPHAGRDTISPRGAGGSRYFNPRAPCGARPHRQPVRGGADVISIHAPHAGRDRIPARATSIPRYFNPRAPCGARRYRAPCKTGRS